jgi:predicted nucleotidyltransferase
MSDVDVALVIEPPTRSSYDQLKLELSIQAGIEDAARAVECPAGAEADAVGPIELPEIDVRIINNAPLTVQGRILQESVLVYEGNHQARVDFEVATRKRYFDFAPVAKRLQEALLDHVHREGILNG